MSICCDDSSRIFPIEIYNPVTINNSQGSVFTQVFSNADLVDGKLTVTHNLDSVLVNVIVYKPISTGIYSIVIPNNIEIYNHNVLYVDLRYFPVNTGWLVLVKPQ